jgi:hypothetical protein
MDVAGFSDMVCLSTRTCFVLNTVRVIKFRRLTWAGHDACKGEARHVYKILIRKYECKIAFGRLRHRWIKNIKIDLKETEHECMDWINLAQDRVQVFSGIVL